MPVELSGTGVWSIGLRYADPGEIAETAAELEELGYCGLWIPDPGGEVFDAVERLLRATKQVVVATGVLNLWMHTPEETAQAHARITAHYGPRFLLGVGASHAPLVEEALGKGRYRNPVRAMQSFLDGLDGAATPLGADSRVLAALGPRMLELARSRASGAHPYNVSPEHTAFARRALGTSKLLAPEQAVVLTDDPATGRELARQYLNRYLELENYAKNFLRLGFSEDDMANGCSDRLVDAIVVWGDEEAITARIEDHRAAGADHVCIQVLGDDPLPREAWRRLAPALRGT